MNRVELYSYAKCRLEKLADDQGISSQDYYSPKKYDEITQKRFPSSSDYYFYLFCGHFADRQYMGNIVKFYTKEDTKNKRPSKTELLLKDILFDFSTTKTIEYYKDKESFLNKTFENLKKNNSEINTEKWNEYLSGIYIMANWLVGNKLDSFLADLKSVDELKIIQYNARKIQKAVKGVGPAVCYNWLKECGAESLAKPDLHIKRVVAELIYKENNHKLEIPQELTGSKRADKILEQYLKLSENKVLKEFPNNSGISRRCKLSIDEYVAVYMFEWAKEVNETPFKLDRVLYLYCTNGYFYGKSTNKSDNISEKDLLNQI